MTFDPTKPHKNVDGININLTDQEIADIAIAEAAYVPPPPPIPDLATQIASALIAKGTLIADDLNPETFAAVNATLTAAQLSPIK